MAQKAYLTNKPSKLSKFFLYFPDVVLLYQPLIQINILNKPMGYVCHRVWVMGYCGPMGYGVEFPANGLGASGKYGKNLEDLEGLFVK